MLVACAPSAPCLTRWPTAAVALAQLLESCAYRNADDRGGSDRLSRKSVRAVHRLPRVRLLANILWFVPAGFWLFLGYAFAALLCFVFIVTIPFGVASLRIALFGVWPFGRAVVPQANKGVGSRFGNILWFILGGFWLALLHLITGIFLCLTIIGIPLGIANLKLINVSMRPFGREIVSADEARRRGSTGVIF